jgi:hypothetical protein
VAVPSRMMDRILVLSKLKQTNYATVLTDGNLQIGKRVPPESAVFGQPDVKRWTSQTLSMKGTDFAGQVQETERDLVETLNLVGDSWLLPWAFAMAMGNVTSTQPNAGGAPTAWQHVIRPLDPSSAGKDLPATTIYSEAANTANLQRRLQSMCVKDVTLDFPKSSPLKCVVNLIGSGAVTTGALASPPAVMTLVPLMSNDLVFKYGTQGAPTDISSQIIAGSLKFSFTWNPDDANSRAPSGGLYRSRMWVGTPHLNLSFRRLVDDAASTPSDDFFADTIQEVLFSVNGPLIAAAEFHRISIRGLAVIPQVVKIGQEGDKSVYQYTFGPDHWLKQGSNDVVTVTCENLETSFLV